VRREIHGRVMRLEVDQHLSFFELKPYSFTVARFQTDIRRGPERDRALIELKTCYDAWQGTCTGGKAITRANLSAVAQSNRLDAIGTLNENRVRLHDIRADETLFG
ncbi:MAG: hypothetical protein AVDCRST_MAG93-4925, partial [uncultured Chloroflexia bacterium]